MAHHYRYGGLSPRVETVIDRGDSQEASEDGFLLRLQQALGIRRLARSLPESDECLLD